MMSLSLNNREKVMELKVNGFAKWTSTDDDGTFSHIGKVIMINDEAINIEDPHGGYMHIPLNDGKIVGCRKPSDWGKFVKKSPNYVPPIGKVVKAKAPTKPKTGSKKEKSIAIYASMMDGTTHPDKADIIQKFIDDLDMTNQGATTYYYTAKSGNK